MSVSNIRKIEQVRLLFMQAPVSNSVICIIAVFYYLILRSRVQEDQLFAWMVMLMFAAAYRFSLWARWKRFPASLPAKTWLKFYLLSCGLVGLAWCPIYFLLVDSSDIFVVCSLLMLGFGVCSSAVPILSSYMPAYIVYTYPQGVALCLAFGGIGDGVGIYLVLAIIVYFVMTTIFTWNNNRRIQDAINIHVENYTLIENLNREVDEREKLISERTLELQEKNRVLVGEIIERKKTEGQLKKLNIELNATLQAIPDYLYVFDENGDYVDLWVNAPDDIGVERKRLIGQNVLDILPQDAAEKVIDTIREASDEGFSRGNIVKLPSKHGLRWFELSTSIKPVSAKENHYLMLSREVTDKIRMEDELMKAKKLESVGVLAGGIAHDFNNILTAIIGNVELAQKYLPTNKKAQKVLANAQKASMRATKLTKQLLTFSKGGDPFKEATPLMSLIKESAEFVLHGSLVSCEYAISDDLWMVNADSGQVEQVIQNIILNAKDALPDGGIVTIQCENFDEKQTMELFGKQERKMVKISITDKGSGIPAEILDKIFDPYFTTKDSGHGLGLSISHTIISKHDGSLQVESSPENGTTFTIYLPALSQEMIDKQKKVEIPARKRSGQILVVDDEQFIRDLVLQQLTPIGFTVKAAQHGDEGIEKFISQKKNGTQFDLVIMDLTIPGGTGGVQAAQKIRELDKDVKIIVSSGYSNDPVMANYKKYGFNSALPKPFELGSLVKCIDAVLG